MTERPLAPPVLMQLESERSVPLEATYHHLSSFLSSYQNPQRTPLSTTQSTQLERLKDELGVTSGLIDRKEVESHEVKRRALEKEERRRVRKERKEALERERIERKEKEAKRLAARRKSGKDTQDDSNATFATTDKKHTVFDDTMDADIDPDQTDGIDHEATFAKNGAQGPGYEQNSGSQEEEGAGLPDNEDGRDSDSSDDEDEDQDEDVKMK